jgi:hypothetical protein
VDIGPPRRTIEVEPTSIPLPGAEPLPVSEPVPEPVSDPAEVRPASPTT